MTNESVIKRKVGLMEYRKTNIFYSSIKLGNFENNSRNHQKFINQLDYYRLVTVILFGVYTKW